MKPLILTLLALLVSASPTWSLDQETLALERDALCQAMPYRCPGFVPTPEPSDALCASLEHPKERGTAAAVEADRLWQASCRNWYTRKAAERAGILSGNPRYSSTIDCYTTHYEGVYSSRLTTTCTSY